MLRTVLQLEGQGTLASVDVCISEYASITGAFADRLWLVSWCCPLEFLANLLGTSDARVRDLSSVAKVRVDANCLKSVRKSNRNRDDILLRVDVPPLAFTPSRMTWRSALSLQLPHER